MFYSARLRYAAVPSTGTQKGVWPFKASPPKKGRMLLRSLSRAVSICDARAAKTGATGPKTEATHRVYLTVPCAVCLAKSIVTNAFRAPQW